MGKRKPSLCVISALCFCVLVVAGLEDSGQSQSLGDGSEFTIPEPNFVSVQNSIRQLQKAHKEIKELKESCKRNDELSEQVKLLSKRLDDMQQKQSTDQGVWLLTPRLRGPPGHKGEQGQVGSPASKGEQGQIGQKGDQGQVGSLGSKGERGQIGQAGPKGERGRSALYPISSCSDAMETLPPPRSKKESIYPYESSKKVQVLCDFDVNGGGWTVIQKRTSGPRDQFDQNWNEYANGFGSLDGNFWLGLDNIHALTKNGDQELRIELEDFEGNKRYAKYSSFSISDASDFYRLSISEFSADSTAGDSMTNSTYTSSWLLNGMRFSTKDKDNDQRGGNCADDGRGGWWYNACSESKLNGRYWAREETVPDWKGIVWQSWKGWNYSLAKTEMKIRTRKS